MWKQFVIEMGIDALVDIMVKNPSSKFTKFLTSEKMQKTMQDVVVNYNRIVDEYEKEKAQNSASA